MKNRILLGAFLSFCFSNAQVYTFSSEKEGKTITHRIMMDDNYLVETQFISNPAEFILTRGGFYTKKDNTYQVALEFNSNHENVAVGLGRYLEKIHQQSNRLKRKMAYGRENDRRRSTEKRHYKTKKNHEISTRWAFSVDFFQYRDLSVLWNWRRVLHS
jgi:hypothetical protein